MALPDSPPSQADAVLLLDGATGTELGRRGADLSPPLWSARALIESPEFVRDIHREYLEAGADAVTTATFRTHRRSLAKAGLGDEAARLTALAVSLAREARDEINPEALVLGSVAPLEECYQPHLAPAAEVCAREHGEIIRHLLDAGADVILIETMCSLREALAAAEQAQNLAPGKWMLSFLTTSAGPPGMLLDGDTIIDALETLRDAMAIGVNCVPPAMVEANAALLRSLLGPPQTAPGRAQPRILGYANVGTLGDDGAWCATDATDPEVFAEHAMRWLDAGASIVGGCCGTTPATVRAMRKRLNGR